MKRTLLKAVPCILALLACIPAAVLAATVLTGAAAIAGLTRTAGTSQPPPPTVSQIVGPAPTGPPRVEPGD